MIDYKQAGQRIRERRKSLGLTQEMLSEKIQITPSFYSQIESGTRKAGIKTFVALSQVLSMSLDDMLGNKIKAISTQEFDNTEYKIFYHLRKLSDKEKEFILDVVISLEKISDT